MGTYFCGSWQKKKKKPQKNHLDPFYPYVIKFAFFVISGPPFSFEICDIHRHITVNIVISVFII